MVAWSLYRRGTGSGAIELIALHLYAQRGMMQRRDSSATDSVAPQRKNEGNRNRRLGRLSGTPIILLSTAQ